MSAVLLRALLASSKAHPDLSLLAVVAGILLLYAECNLPGTVLPGCLGTLTLMLGLFALSRLPLHPAAVAVTLAGLALVMLAIASTRSLPAATLGLVLLTGGLFRLVDPARSPIGVDLPTALLAALLFTVSTVWLGRVALRARRQKQILRRPALHPQSRLDNSDLR